MFIPKTFKDTIAKTFYDKSINILTSVETTNAEGGVNKRGFAVSSTFNGNVCFTNFKSIQEGYGIDYQIDISITTNIDTSINVEDIISYDSTVYKVSDVIPTDSHLLIVATKWRQ